MSDLTCPPAQLVQFSHGLLVSSEDVSKKANTPHVDYEPDPSELVNPCGTAPVEPVAPPDSGTEHPIDLPIIGAKPPEESAQEEPTAAEEKPKSKSGK